MYITIILQFLKGPLLDGLYLEQDVNGKVLAANEQGYLYNVNKLVGVPRIRQLRVRSQTCIVLSAFKEQILDCYAGFSDETELRTSFGTGNGSA